MPFQDERELPAKIEGVLHAAVHSLSARGRVDVRGIAGEKHVSLTKRIGQANPGFPSRVPHDIAHRDAVEMLLEQTHECLLRSDRWIGCFAAIAQQQSEVTAGK